ncbi:MAG TPA: hypothetical protein VFB23_03840 [Candidatus Acidoferrales bacterium]|nr:hypothetical protein [Candidatus Acidoferrales bacterium]
MSEYIPFFVIGVFGALLFIGTIIWTECLFPERKKPEAKQAEIKFPEPEPTHREFAHR